jgi:hypothetical protein
MTSLSFATWPPAFPLVGHAAPPSLDEIDPVAIGAGAR